MFSESEQQREMKYKEQWISRCIFFVREILRKTRYYLKKIKKIWLQRREYISLHFWLKRKEKFKELQKKDMGCPEKEPHSTRHHRVELSNKKLAVYTCIFGEYDKIKEPLFKSKYCDYYIITDQSVSSKSVWKKIFPEVTPEGFDDWHPAIKNRYYKMHPQDVFKEYEYSLYIDGNVRPMTDLYSYAQELENSKKLLGVFRHPIFDCLYDSAEHLKHIDLVDCNMMDTQIEAYRLEGFPRNFGFFECALIVRKHGENLCCAVMDTWWQEYNRGVKRDQQSFTYALWKNGLDASAVCSYGRNIRESLRIKITNHKKVHEKVIE